MKNIRAFKQTIKLYILKRVFCSWFPCHIHADHFLIILKKAPHCFSMQQPYNMLVQRLICLQMLGSLKVQQQWSNGSYSLFTLNCSPAAPNFLSPQIINGLSFPLLFMLVQLPFNLVVDSHWNGRVKIFHATGVIRELSSYDSVSDSLHCFIMPQTDPKVTTSKQTSVPLHGALLPLGTMIPHRDN